MVFSRLVIFVVSFFMFAIAQKVDTNVNDVSTSSFSTSSFAKYVDGTDDLLKNLLNNDTSTDETTVHIIDAAEFIESLKNIEEKQTPLILDGPDDVWDNPSLYLNQTHNRQLQDNRK